MVARDFPAWFPIAQSCRIQASETARVGAGRLPQTEIKSVVLLGVDDPEICKIAPASGGGFKNGSADENHRVEFYLQLGNWRLRAGSVAVG